MRVTCEAVSLEYWQYLFAKVGRGLFLSGREVVCNGSISPQQDQTTYPRTPIHPQDQHPVGSVMDIHENHEFRNFRQISGARFPLASQKRKLEACVTLKSTVLAQSELF
jgi:hypothetical protein